MVKSGKKLDKVRELAEVDNGVKDRGRENRGVQRGGGEEDAHGMHGSEGREASNRRRGRQPVVRLPTPSVYFHITSVKHRDHESQRDAEREEMNTLMCYMLTPQPDTSC